MHKNIKNTLLGLSMILTNALPNLAAAVDIETGNALMRSSSLPNLGHAMATPLVRSRSLGSLSHIVSNEVNMLRHSTSDSEGLTSVSASVGSLGSTYAFDDWSFFTLLGGNFISYGVHANVVYNTRNKFGLNSTEFYTSINNWRPNEFYLYEGLRNARSMMGLSDWKSPWLAGSTYGAIRLGTLLTDDILTQQYASIPVHFAGTGLKIWLEQYRWSLAYAAGGPLGLGASFLLDPLSNSGISTLESIVIDSMSNNDFRSAAYAGLNTFGQNIIFESSKWLAKDAMGAYSRYMVDVQGIATLYGLDISRRINWISNIAHYTGKYSRVAGMITETALVYGTNSTFAQSF